MVQKTIIDTLHKEGKSQRVITERVAVQGVLYQSILNAKLTGRKELGRKMCTSNRHDRKLENTVKQSRYKHLRELHKEWTEKSPRSDIFRKRAEVSLLKLKHHQKHLTSAKEKKNWTVAQWSKVLFLDESKFSFSFGNQGPRVWRKSGEAQKSSVKFPVSDDLGCHVICWCWSAVFSEVHSQHSHLPGHFRALHASFCWQALWRCWFHFSSRTWHLPTLPKVPKAGSMTMVLLCLIGQQTHLTWTPCIDNLRGIVKKKMRESDPTMQMTWRPLSTQPGLPLHLSSATGWLPPCHAAFMQ